MGEGHLQVPDASNPRGYYEDLRWNAINKSLTGWRYSARAVWTLPKRQAVEYDKLALLCSGAPIWGVKNPQMAFVFQDVWPIIDRYSEVRVVHVVRNRGDATRSLVAHSHTAYGGSLSMHPSKAAGLLSRWDKALSRGLETFEGPVHEVQFERVLADPVTEIAHLARFAFAPEYDRCNGMAGAIQFADATLWHQKEAAYA
jgi:hypothetical protein